MAVALTTPFPEHVPEPVEAEAALLVPDEAAVQHAAAASAAEALALTAAVAVADTVEPVVVLELELEPGLGLELAHAPAAAAQNEVVPAALDEVAHHAESETEAACAEPEP